MRYSADRAAGTLGCASNGSWPCGPTA